MRMDIGSLLAAYRKRATTPRAVVAEICARIESDSAYCAWIHVLAPEQLEPYLLRLESAAATPAVRDGACPRYQCSFAAYPHDARRDRPTHQPEDLARHRGEPHPRE